MTSRFTLAAHILAMLAWSDRARRKPVTSEEMARSINTNPVVVRRVLSDLRRAGLVETKRGVGGGVTLARRADSVTLRDAYEAIEEGEELFGRHPSGPNPCCRIGPLVAEFMDEVHGRAETAMKRELEGVTVAAMSHEIEARVLSRLQEGRLQDGRLEVGRLQPPRVPSPRKEAPPSGRRSSTRAVPPRVRTATG